MKAVGSAGAERIEIVTARAYVLLRAAVLLQALLAAAATYPHYRPIAAGLGLTVGLVAQSAALIAVTLVRHRVPPAWLIGLETGVIAGELVVGFVVIMPVHGHTWAYFIYPFSLVAIIGVGLSFRRLSAVVAVSAVPAAVYSLLSVLLQHVPPWNATLDSMSYLLHSGLGWLIAGALRRASRELDAVHRVLTDREVELAEEQARLRHARMLHDRVLQTLEILGQGDFVADPALRSHVRAEATWVRSFVRGESRGDMPDLPAALAAVAREMTRSGLAVQVNTAQLANALHRCGELSAETTEALAGAAREALVNVLKHAGTRDAVLNAGISAQTLTVSVLDHGCGFDEQVREAGFGLSMSIRSRLAAIGGEASVESRPGLGTYVELRVPAPRLRARAFLAAPASSACAGCLSPHGRLRCRVNTRLDRLRETGGILARNGTGLVDSLGGQ
jgi:signal transduction histidine kinase